MDTEDNRGALPYELEAELAGARNGLAVMRRVLAMLDEDNRVGMYSGEWYEVMRQGPLAVIAKLERRIDQVEQWRGLMPVVIRALDSHHDEHMKAAWEAVYDGFVEAFGLDDDDPPKVMVPVGPKAKRLYQPLRRNARALIQAKLYDQDVLKVVRALRNIVLHFDKKEDRL